MNEEVQRIIISGYIAQKIESKDYEVWYHMPNENFNGKSPECLLRTSEGRDTLIEHLRGL